MIARRMSWGPYTGQCWFDDNDGRLVVSIVPGYIVRHRATDQEMKWIVGSVKGTVVTSFDDVTCPDGYCDYIRTYIKSWAYDLTPDELKRLKLKAVK